MVRCGSNAGVIAGVDGGSGGGGGDLNSIQLPECEYFDR